MSNLYFIALVYESVILSITFVFIVQVLKICIKQKNRLNILLLLLISNYFIAIFFSWLSKFQIIYSNIDYLYDESVSDPLTPLSWILLRISDFRISFLFITIATYTSYIFKEKIFGKEFKKSQNYIVIISGILVGFYTLVIYQKGNLILDVLAFFLVFLLMGSVYISFMKNSIRSYKNSTIPTYRNAFLSLAIMSLSFALILFCFLIDRIYIFLGDYGFTFFYYLGWIFAIIGVTGAYFGYLKLKEKEN